MRLDFSQIFGVLKKTAVKHVPEFLTAIGIGCTTYAVYNAAFKATPKAMKILEEHDGKELSKKEAVKLTWKCYVPVVASWGVGTACLIGANSVNAKRNAVLAAAYTISETARKEYEEAAAEIIGDKKEQAIRDRVAEKELQKMHPNSEVVVTGIGDTLCYDAISGRTFRSDIEKIRQVVNTLNQRLISEMYISLNEFYTELFLPPIELGDMLGWNVNKGLIEVSYSSQLDDRGTPCLVVNYMVMPRYDYRDLY